MAMPQPGILVPSGVPLDAAGVPAGEACPPPLQWQEVLNAYRSDSEAWELDRGDRRLIGRTWGQGQPLYLLNGFAATAELNALLVYLLRDTFRCVVFDTLATTRTRASIQQYADDLMAVADHHQHAAIGLFASSVGSQVALQAALDHPRRIRGLALQHGFARRRLSWSERIMAHWYRRSRRPLSSLGWRRRIQELNHGRWFPPFDNTRFEFLVDSTGQIPLRDLAQKALAIHATDLSGQLSGLDCPVLLIRTEGQGQQESAGHESLEKLLPQAQTESLHSTGLHPYLTHPHRLAKLLKPFFSPEPVTRLSLIPGHDDRPASRI